MSPESDPGMTSAQARRLADSLTRPPADLRQLLCSPVRAQGPRPVSLPFALSVAHEATRARLGAPGAETLAVEPLWQHCVEQGRAGQDGTTLTAARAALQARGQTTQACWPYDETLGSGSQPQPASATGGVWYTAEVIDTSIAHDGVESVIEDALASGLPVVLIIELSKEFEHPGGDGEIAVPALTAAAGDYHAVVAVGAATNEAANCRRLLVRNSWGPGWGAGGYGWLPMEYLIAFGMRAVAIDHTTLAATGLS